MITTERADKCSVNRGEDERVGVRRGQLSDDRVGDFGAGGGCLDYIHVSAPEPSTSSSRQSLSVDSLARVQANT